MNSKKSNSTVKGGENKFNYLYVPADRFTFYPCPLLYIVVQLLHQYSKSDDRE